MTAAAVLALGVDRARADGGAGGGWVIEPTPEQAGATSAGTAEIAHAQQLARSKQYVDAVRVLEALDRAHPAAVHDCNLALAYLRAGVLTRAQLMWDVSGLRGAERPRWCTGDLAKQLSTALRAAGYVALEVQVTPSTAVIEIAGIETRGVRTIWLAPGPYTVVAHAPGLADESQPVTVAAPGARVAITMSAPRGDGRGGAATTGPTGASTTTTATIGTGAPTNPPTGPRSTATTLSATTATGTSPDTRPTAPDRASPGGGPVDLDATDRLAPAEGEPTAEPTAPARWPAWVAIGGGAIAIGAGAVFHARALSARDDGDRAYQGSPALAAAQDRFSSARTEALVSYAVGVAALGVGAWWWHSHRSTPAVSAAIGGGGATLTFTWTTGGP